MMLCLILISLFVPVLKAQENPEILYAPLGGSVTLHREKIKGESEKAESVYVNWYQEPKKILTISRNPQSGIQKGKDATTHASLSEDFSLKISPVQESDFVIWLCEQHVLTQTYKKTYKLYKVYIPKVPAVIVGGSLSLECLKESSSVQTRVIWTSPKNAGCQERKQYTETIMVTDVSVCHSGVWTCMLKYGNQICTASTTVFVIDLAPSPPDPIYTSAFYPSSKVCVPCSLYSEMSWSVLNESGLLGGSWSFTPLSEQKSSSLFSLTVGSVVRWDTAQGASITASQNQITNRNLSIFLPVSEKIRGVYSCNLKFTTKTLSQEVKVEVLQVFSSGGSQVLFEGQSVNLTCTLGHSNTPDLEIKWIKSSSVLKSSSHPSVLSIPQLKLQDKGWVKCELWKKDEMLTSAQLQLKVEKAPVDIWLCVAITSGVVVFILLVVIIIICIRRHKQMMMYRRRKTRFCCCNNQQPKGFYKT